MNELLKVRGLEKISVRSVPDRLTSKQPTSDAWYLEKLLKTKVLHAKPMDMERLKGIMLFGS